MIRITLKEKKWLFLNQERKDKRIIRIMLKERKKERKWLFLNRKKKDDKMNRILPILKSLLSWFRKTNPSFKLTER